MLNSVFLALLDRPMKNENGTSSFEHQVFYALWFKFADTLITEENARIYEQSVSKLYTVSRNEEGDEETDLFQCWSTFWTTVGIRFPQVAGNQIETLLNEFIDRKQINLVYPLQV